MNALTATTALFSFSVTLFGVFAPIYLWELEYQIWEICLFFLLESIAFLIVLFVIIPWFRNITDRLLFSLSIPALIAYLIGLSFLPEYPVLFFLLPILQAFNRLCFDCAHAFDFAVATNHDSVGRQIGFQNTILSIATFLAPLAGSYLIIQHGFGSLFISSALMLIIALTPLFLYTPNKLSNDVSRSLLLRYIFNKETLPHSISCAGYAGESLIGRYLWPLYIFIFFGSISTFGFIISFGMLFATVTGYIVGYYSDNGKRVNLIRFLSIGNALTYIFRLLISSTFGLITIHVGSVVILRSLHVPWGTYNYELAKDTEHIGVFMLSRIAIYHLARVAIWPILIALSLLFTDSQFFTASFIIGAAFSLMYLTATAQQTSRNLSTSFQSN